MSGELSGYAPNLVYNTSAVGMDTFGLGKVKNWWCISTYGTALSGCRIIRLRCDYWITRQNESGIRLEKKNMCALIY